MLSVQVAPDNATLGSALAVVSQVGVLLFRQFRTLPVQALGSSEARGIAPCRVVHLEVTGAGANTARSLRGAVEGVLVPLERLALTRTTDARPTIPGLRGVRGLTNITTTADSLRTTSVILVEIVTRSDLRTRCAARATRVRLLLTSEVAFSDNSLSLF